jgi:hypothetical protein
MSDQQSGPMQQTPARHLTLEDRLAAMEQKINELASRAGSDISDNHLILTLRQIVDKHFRADADEIAARLAANGASKQS